MDERRSGDAAVTGVAKGALGTGTALDETQEWVIPEGLQGNAAMPAADPSPAPALIAAAAPVAAAAPAPVEPVAAEPVTRRRPARTTSGARFSPGPRTAGIAAALLLALVGVTAVVTTLDRDDAGAATPAQAPSAAPTDAPAADGAGNGGGGKKDKDNGKGNGNGNGNGGGRGNN